jgi:microcystin-dependent protein
VAQNYPNLDYPFTEKNLRITQPWAMFLRTLWERTGGSSGGVSVPTGQGALFFGPTAPDGWLLCDGSAVSRSIYSALFSILGTTWGAGDGVSTFNLPDLRARFPLGSVSAGPDTVGAYGGTNEVTLTVNELPEHNHPLTGKAHTHSVTDPGHTHTITDPGHTHGVTDPQHTHTITDAGHDHTIGSTNAAGAGVFASQAAADTGDVTTDMSTTGIAIDLAATNVSVNTDVTNVTAEDAPTGIVIDPATALGTVGNRGLGLPFSIQPAYAIVNYIIKT